MLEGKHGGLHSSHDLVEARAGCLSSQRGKGSQKCGLLERLHVGGHGLGVSALLVGRIQGLMILIRTNTLNWTKKQTEPGPEKLNTGNCRQAACVEDSLPEPGVQAGDANSVGGASLTLHAIIKTASGKWKSRLDVQHLGPGTRRKL